MSIHTGGRTTPTAQLESLDSDYEESEARTSPIPHSSSPPYIEYESESDPLYNFFTHLLHNLPPDDQEDTDEDFKPRTPKKQPRMKAQTNDQKAHSSLQYMRTTFSRFSLRTFLETVFTSNDSQVKQYSNKFLAEGSHLKIMDRWWEVRGGARDGEMADWVIQKAAELLGREISHLTNRAADGPHKPDADFLRVSSKDVNVKLVEEFKIQDLTSRYDRVTPYLQHILRAVIGKSDDTTGGAQSHVRNPDVGRTLVTSMLLNLRSRLSNYHATINSLILWKSRVPKRIVQMFNQFGISASPDFQSKAVNSLSNSAIDLARQTASNPNKIKMLPYDNFNWVQKAWETSATHGSINHDEVSALLVAIPTPEGKSASDIVSVSGFEATASKRHEIPRRKALNEIIPDAKDQQEYRANAILHVQHILAEDVQSLSHFRDSIKAFFDPKAIKPQKTEEYFLPTFDQEQGSTRGNMIVLEHYLNKVLRIAKGTFEKIVWLVLGDRLTAARDRAAQDQRALDRSPHKFDHLSSLKVVNGLMHFNLNFIRALARNYWGTGTGLGHNPVSLSAFRHNLPNRSEINDKKFDYYGWLRFLDVILRALVLQATLQSLGINTVAELGQMAKDRDGTWLEDLATSVVDSFLLPAPSRLEATGVKGVKWPSVTGNAMLLMHDLMTLHEMRHAIKNGHPTRIVCMIKYWLPMFYAAGSHNYANECMELLHNLVHDWPADFAEIALQGMLVNPHGIRDGFKETDIRVEHLNDDIKEHAHGSNATPALLEKITPSIGHLKNLSDSLFMDIGVERLNQRHANVRQGRDIDITLKYLQDKHIFNFSLDVPSEHGVVDLFQAGMVALSGPNGGHARHLARHKGRLQQRHAQLDNHEILKEMEDIAPLEYFITSENIVENINDSDEEEQ